MQSNFTPRAGQIIINAKKEAKRYNHHYVGTEHILLGIIGLDDGIAINVLHKLGIDLAHIRSEIENRVGFGPDTKLVGEPPFTPRAAKVLKSAAFLAKSLKHSFVGTEHIFLALANESDGIASKVFTSLGVEYDKVHELVHEELDALNIPSAKSLKDHDLSIDYDEEFEKVLGSKPSKSNTPALDAYGQDLTLIASQGKLDPVIGRENEIERVTQILCRRQKNNPILIGEAGVGKTAIVEGLAQKIVAGQVPELLAKKRIIALDITLMVAGTVYRGQFEERIKAVMSEIKRNGNIIIFIDEMHTIVGTGATQGSNDASNIIKPSLSRGELQCIGATTMDEYRNYIEKDAALERRFQNIIVDPPNVAETIEILKGLRSKYEDFHNVSYTEQALEAAVKLSQRYISGRYLPDKAIDIMDEAGARVHLQKRQKSPVIENNEKILAELSIQKKEAVKEQRYEEAAAIRNKERETLAKIEDIKKRRADSERIVIDNDDMAEVLSKWVGIPTKRLEEGEAKKLLRMEDELHQRVVGQDDAIKSISRSLRRSRANLKDPRRPIGSFIFLGPTGVGKSLLAKALAEFMFDDIDSLITVDMSEYMEKFSTSRFIGSPPGYVGHEEGGQLSEKIRRKPYSVILFDEIEKAHPDVLHILLQVLEEGKLTDGLGRTIDFRNTVIIMTSNIGASELLNKGSLGFTNNGQLKSLQENKGKLLAALKKHFKPEFLNRVDDTIVFAPLSKDEIMSIINLELKQVISRLKEHNIYLELTEPAKKFLFQKGYDPLYGARPVRRAIELHIEDALSELILRDHIPEHSTVTVKVKNSELIFEAKLKALNSV